MLILATALLVAERVPDVVGISGDLKLYTVVACRNGRQVPLELRDLATLVQVLENQDEEQTNQRGSSSGEAHEFVFLSKLGLALRASVLNEKVVRFVVTKAVPAPSPIVDPKARVTICISR